MIIVLVNKDKTLKQQIQFRDCAMKTSLLTENMKVHVACWDHLAVGVRDRNQELVLNWYWLQSGSHQSAIKVYNKCISNCI